jgi:hypothetical protein
MYTGNVTRKIICTTPYGTNDKKRSILSTPMSFGTCHIISCAWYLTAEIVATFERLRNAAGPESLAASVFRLTFWPLELVYTFHLQKATSFQSAVDELCRSLPPKIAPAAVLPPVQLRPNPLSPKQQRFRRLLADDTFLCSYNEATRRQ